MKPNDFSQMKVLTPADLGPLSQPRSALREDRHPNALGAEAIAAAIARALADRVTVEPDSGK